MGDGTQRGIGQGLAAILPLREAEAPELRELPVEVIRPNPDQPRSTFDPETIRELAESVGAAGVLQPVIVRPLANGTYELVTGERRWRAAREAGLERIPAVIRDHDEAERLQTALIENMAREDLNPVDEAHACAALVEDLGLTKEELARRVGRSRAAISNLIRLLDLPEDVQELLRSGELSEGHGRAILQARGVDARRRLAREAAARGWSVRETERRAQRLATANGDRRRPRRPEVDLSGAEEALEAALGHDVKVRATRDGLRAELAFDDIDELLAFSRRVGRRR